MRGWLAGLGLGVLLGAAGFAVASEPDCRGHQHERRATHAQPYAGQQHRAIASFSDEDMADLREGRGMGLAKPAELNGYPGPLHVLELAVELGLSDEQRRSVEEIFARMKEAARAAGARYLEAESAVNAAFRSGDATPERIADLVRQADGARAEVRLAHLTAHIETVPLLSPEQRWRYAELRGYADSSGDQHNRQHRH